MTTSFMEPGKECSHAWELMPWVLQDSATEEQSEWLMAHLARCESCSAEFAQQHRLRQAMQLPTDVPVDAEAGLQRLLDRLDAPERQQPSHGRAGHWVIRALAAAVLVQAIGLGVLGMKLSAGGPAPAYRTLSDPAAAPPPGAIRVVPDAHMTLAGWDALLRTSHLRVVGGPNEVGAYMLVVAAGAPAMPPAQLVQRLRSTPGIRLAEPVSAP